MRDLRARAADGRPVGFRVEARRAGDTLYVVPVGELDVITCGTLRDELEPAVADGAVHVVLDLSRLTFMDSSGVHLLVTTQQAAAGRGIRFSLVRGPAIVTRVLALTGMQDRFEFVQQ